MYRYNRHDFLPGLHIPRLLLILLRLHPLPHDPLPCSSRMTTPGLLSVASHLVIIILMAPVSEARAGARKYYCSSFQNALGKTFCFL